MILTLDRHDIKLIECNSVPNSYFYTLYKGGMMCYKQRTALSLNEIIKEVKELIRINSNHKSIYGVLYLMSY